MDAQCPHCHAPVTSENEHVVPAGLSCEYRCKPPSERCSNCDPPLAAHVINADGKPLCADPPVDWRARCLAAERDYCDALELIDDFKSAIGVNVGGDPGGVTPGHVEEFVHELGLIHRAGRELIKHMEAHRSEQGNLIYSEVPISVLGDFVDAVSAFAAKYPEE